MGQEGRLEYMSVNDIILFKHEPIAFVEVKKTFSTNKTL